MVAEEVGHFDRREIGRPERLHAKGVATCSDDPVAPLDAVRLQSWVFYVLEPMNVLQDPCELDMGRRQFRKVERIW
jgi:hypothetical protein